MNGTPWDLSGSAGKSNGARGADGTSPPKAADGVGSDCALFGDSAAVVGQNGQPGGPGGTDGPVILVFREESSP
jgi:hypothetical protein